MKILRGYQKQTRAGDGKLKPQFPRPKNKHILLFNVHGAKLQLKYKEPHKVYDQLQQVKI